MNEQSTENPVCASSCVISVVGPPPFAGPYIVSQPEVNLQPDSHLFPKLELNDGMRKLSAATIVTRWDAKVLLGYNIKKQGWEFGGGKNQDNERIEETARRELGEEVGWDTSGMVFGRVSRPYEDDPGWFCVLFRVIVLRGGEQPLPDHPPEPSFREWRWFSREQVLALPDLRGNCRTILKNVLSWS